MTTHDVLQRLLKACSDAGSQRAFAKRWGLSPAYVSDVLKLRREPGPSILIPLGLQKVVEYEPLPESHP